MAQLPNERHELYAKHRARGMKPAQAAIASGFASGSAVYAGLEKDHEVQARVAELMDEIKLKKEQQRAAAVASAREVGALTGKSKAWVIQQLAENAQMARQDGDYANANTALKMIGDELGMFKGGSAGEVEDANGVKTYDMDVLESVLDQARAELTPPEDAPGLRDAPLPADALKLIEGHGAAAKRIREARRLSTGSETDVALTQEAEIEDDDFAEEEFEDDEVHDEAPDAPEAATPEIDVTDAEEDEEQAPERRSQRHARIVHSGGMELVYPGEGGTVEPEPIEPEPDDEAPPRRSQRGRL